MEEGEAVPSPLPSVPGVDESDSSTLPAVPAVLAVDKSVPAVDESMPSTVPAVDESMPSTVPAVDESMPSTVPAVDESMPSTVPAVLGESCGMEVEAEADRDEGGDMEVEEEPVLISENERRIAELEKKFEELGGQKNYEDLLLLCAELDGDGRRIAARKRRDDLWIAAKVERSKELKRKWEEEQARERDVGKRLDDLRRELGEMEIDQGKLEKELESTKENELKSAEANVFKVLKEKFIPAYDKWVSAGRDVKGNVELYVKTAKEILGSLDECHGIVKEMLDREATGRGEATDDDLIAIGYMLRNHRLLIAEHLRHAEWSIAKGKIFNLMEGIQVSDGLKCGSKIDELWDSLSRVRSEVEWDREGRKFGDDLAAEYTAVFALGKDGMILKIQDRSFKDALGSILKNVTFQMLCGQDEKLFRELATACSALNACYRGHLHERELVSKVRGQVREMEQGIGRLRDDIEAKMKVEQELRDLYVKVKAENRREGSVGNRYEELVRAIEAREATRDKHEAEYQECMGEIASIENKSLREIFDIRKELLLLKEGQEGFTEGSVEARYSAAMERRDSGLSGDAEFFEAAGAAEEEQEDSEEEEECAAEEERAAAGSAEEERAAAGSAEEERAAAGSAGEEQASAETAAEEPESALRQLADAAEASRSPSRSPLEPPPSAGAPGAPRKVYRFYEVLAAAAAEAGEAVDFGEVRRNLSVSLSTAAADDSRSGSAAGGDSRSGSAAGGDSRSGSAAAGGDSRSGSAADDDSAGYTSVEWELLQRLRPHLPRGAKPFSKYYSYCDCASCGTRGYTGCDRYFSWGNPRSNYHVIHGPKKGLGKEETKAVKENLKLLARETYAKFVDWIREELENSKDIMDLEGCVTGPSATKVHDRFRTVCALVENCDASFKGNTKNTPMPWCVTKFMLTPAQCKLCPKHNPKCTMCWISAFEHPHLQLLMHIVWLNHPDVFGLLKIADQIVTVHGAFEGGKRHVTYYDWWAMFGEYASDFGAIPDKGFERERRLLFWGESMESSDDTGDAGIAGAAGEALLDVPVVPDVSGSAAEYRANEEEGEDSGVDEDDPAHDHPTLTFGGRESDESLPIDDGMGEDGIHQYRLNGFSRDVKLPKKKRDLEWKPPFQKQKETGGSASTAPTSALRRLSGSSARSESSADVQYGPSITGRERRRLKAIADGLPESPRVAQKAAEAAEKAAEKAARKAAKKAARKAAEERAEEPVGAVERAEERVEEPVAAVERLEERVEEPVAAVERLEERAEEPVGAAALPVVPQAVASETSDNAEEARCGHKRRGGGGGSKGGGAAGKRLRIADQIAEALERRMAAREESEKMKEAQEMNQKLRDQVQELIRNNKDIIELAEQEQEEIRGYRKLVQKELAEKMRVEEELKKTSDENAELRQELAKSKEAEARLGKELETSEKDRDFLKKRLGRLQKDFDAVRFNLFFGFIHDLNCLVSRWRLLDRVLSSWTWLRLLLSWTWLRLLGSL